MGVDIDLQIVLRFNQAVNLEEISLVGASPYMRGAGIRGLWD
jgi:hypothetical protein